EEKMQRFIQNMRYAMRQLMHAPGFAATVIVTLALGIGANSAIFTIFDQVLLRTLPVQQPKALVRFEWTGSFSGSTSAFGGGGKNYFSYPMYKDLRDKNTVFDGMIAATRGGLGISWNNSAEDADAEIVSGNYFSVLGLKPAVGRFFTDAEDQVKNANPVVVLGYEYWRSRMNASPDVVGQTLLINGHPFTILGVAPADFQSAIDNYKPAAFVPVHMVEVVTPWVIPRDDLNNHRSLWLTVVARLKPGMTMEHAQAAMAPLWHALREEEFARSSETSERFRDRFVNQSRLLVREDSTGFMPSRADLSMPLKVLMGMVGVVAAMCAVNVAILLLLRAAGRVREISVRYALGASRGTIISQLMLEGGLLGLCGAAAGVGITPLITKALVRLITSSDDVMQTPYSTTVDGRILLFSLALSIVVTLLFSLAPAIQFLRPQLAEALRQSAGTASRSSQRFRKVAVGVQIGLTVLLLGGAGLFVRTLNNLRAQSIGFETRHLISFFLDPTLAGYTEDRTVPTETRSLEALRGIPGVLQAAGTTDPEIAGDNSSGNMTVQGYKEAEDEDMNFERPRITPHYFTTLRQPMLAGRDFTDADVKGSAEVAIVNLAFAKRFYGLPQNAIGRLLGDGGGKGVKTNISIVGVVGDVHHSSMTVAPKATVYQPYLQDQHPGGLQMYVQTGPDPKSVEEAVSAEIHRIDPKLIVDGMKTMEEQVDISVSNQRALAMLATSFSALALLLTAIGLYGVLAFATTQRTREIGVRMALGAQRGNVVLLVMREMAWTAMIGVAVALPATYAIGLLFASQLYGVKPGDPVTMVVCVLATGVMLALAAALPARRAASVDPMRALRSE
ncbi:MAG TPA: ABC transporter permease, partial [Acidobacteriaceae bacterium]|nr:ABC transporter permease [Acidobacteriaceae bacterium]